MILSFALIIFFAITSSVNADDAQINLLKSAILNGLNEILALGFLNNQSTEKGKAIIDMYKAFLFVFLLFSFLYSWWVYVFLMSRNQTRIYTICLYSDTNAPDTCLYYTTAQESGEKEWWILIWSLGLKGLT